MPLFSIALALCVLAQASESPLPPGHPPLDGPRTRAGPLPSGHPAFDTPAPVTAPVLPSGHPTVRGGQAPSAAEILQRLDARPDLASKSKTFEISASIGRLYALQGRYPEAARYFAQAVEKTKAAREIFLKHRALRSETPADCQLAADALVESVVAQSVAREKRRDFAGATACAREALARALEAEAWMGNALFLSGDSTGALTTFDRLLEVDPYAPEALYARGGVHFDRGERNLAAEDLRRYLSLAADSPHASQARALLARAEGRAAITPGPARSIAPPSATGPASPPPLSPELIDAVQRTQQTPEFLARLENTVTGAESALAAGRFQEALNQFKQVMPYQPNNGRFRAGMAWALVGLNRQPMADRIWAVAVESDPASVEKLGDTLTKKGDARGAEALYRKLAASAPDYARRSRLMSKLPEAAAKGP